MTTTAVKPSAGTRTPRRTSRGYFVWLTVAGLLCAAMTAYVAVRYLPPDLDSTEGIARGLVHHVLLVAHILTATIAVAIGLAQFWPWLRNNHPRVHRLVGRLYLFAGVLPSAVFGVVVANLSLNGLAASAPLSLLSVLWFVTAVQGFRAARARDYRAHRVWMIRNFALTAAAITGRLWGLTLAVTIGGELVFATANWLSFVVNLLVAEWWIQRRGLKAA
ncbi:DUF2306 domain-containing protein [Lentzea tibetensis]|uniref:DUF2306 domain-containing protein n=1 Tax=Lentzea tibetensis TaxID=2591470 RepID=A0A563ETJ8_9PSEU|nr:DUF2306 domain-containing protein [Lentzea tibetensis]TWP50973.1 DUF2306 domain-containing protein [Lentzea tibetensis]